MIGFEIIENLCSLLGELLKLMILWLDLKLSNVREIFEIQKLMNLSFDIKWLIIENLWNLLLWDESMVWSEIIRSFWNFFMIIKIEITNEQLQSEINASLSFSQDFN